MSRTYRRTEKGQKRSWLPGIYFHDYYRWYYWRTDFSEVDHWLQRCPHRWKDINDHFHWLSNEPWWWRHDMHTVPTRAEVRKMIQNIKHGKIDPDDTVWPDGKKPHQYYW